MNIIEYIYIYDYIYAYIKHVHLEQIPFGESPQLTNPKRNSVPSRDVRGCRPSVPHMKRAAPRAAMPGSCRAILKFTSLDCLRLKRCQQQLPPLQR